MAKILVNKNGQALMSSDGKVYKGAVEQVIPEGYIKPTGKIEITTTDEVDVSEYEKAQVVDSNLEPSVIKKDVTILGVTGTFEGGSSEEYPNEAIKYYKENRNKNYPYFPLPSEMEETQDTIYMLYGASGYMCCPAFNITFTDCVCTIQKYMNTTLVSEYVESVTSGTTKYLQFSEEDSDYSSYNYIVIKLQGNITKHYLDYLAKFNDVFYSSYNSGDELLEVSGKCASCDIKCVNGTNKYHQKLEYYSFLGVNTTSMSSMFNQCINLKTIPELDTHLVTNMSSMFKVCYMLQTIPLLDTSSVTTMSQMFYYCYELQEIPLLDTSLVTDMNGMFDSCHSLQTIPQLDTHLVTNMSKMFYYCYSIKTIPLLDCKLVKKMTSMFSNCYSLEEIPLLDCSSVTDMSGMFSFCYSLESIALLETNLVTTMSSMLQNATFLKKVELDCSSVTTINSIFYSDYLIVKVDMTNIKVSFSLKDSTMLSQSELVKILNNLATVETTQTLTLGNTLLAKLTDEEKAIATNKNWTLA